MRKNRNFLGLGIFLAVLMLAVGYAAINSTPLNITGTAAATPSDASFVVKFDNTVTPVKGGDVQPTEAVITDDRNATITISGLTTKGQTSTATYTVVNNSVDLVASLAETTATITQKGETDYKEYFSVKTEIVGSPLAAAGGTATVKVTVTLEKTPIDENPEVNVNVALSASVVNN